MTASDNPTPWVWQVAPVERQPSLVLSDWSIYELTRPKYGAARQAHVVGHSRRLGEGRVSSHIVEFDPVKRRVRTNSGRVYELAGRPGKHMDAEYTFGMWKDIHEASDVVEVTGAFASEISRNSTDSAG